LDKVESEAVAEVEAMTNEVLQVITKPQPSQGA